MYYPCSENKGADQLRRYCEADLCLCFRLSWQIVGFPMRRLNFNRKSENIIFAPNAAHGTTGVAAFDAV